MSRIRVESLLSSFPKLVSDSEGHDATSQHTYIETESIRYVYQPIEHLYLVLVTTKSSNIVQDLETLRLLGKLVTEYCHPIVTEETVNEAAFELVFAFDEVISLGHKENITLSQIRVNLEMDSHEEKLHDMIRKSKEQEAKDEMRRKATEIKATQRIRGSAGGGRDERRSSFGTNSYAGQAVSPAAADRASGGFQSSTTPTIDAKARAPKKGMQLGAKRKDNDFFKAMAKEDGISVSSKPSMSLKGGRKEKSQVSAPGAVAQPKEDVSVVVAESVSIEFTSDGSMKQTTVNGQLQLTCFKKDVKAQLKCAVSPLDESVFQFNTHPHVDKAAWSKNSLLKLKSASKSFPVDKTLSILKWRVKPSIGEGVVEKIPLTINSWPERSSEDGFTVNIEYELNDLDCELTDVSIIIPLPGAEAPDVVSCETGAPKHNSRKGYLEWSVDVVNAESPTGSLEFELKESSRNADESLFFPTTVSFESDSTMCGIVVEEVVDGDGNSMTVDLTDRRLTLEKYEITYE